MVPTVVWLVGSMFRDLNVGLDGLSEYRMVWMEKLACWLVAKLIVLATNWFDVSHVVCIASSLGGCIHI